MVVPLSVYAGGCGSWVSTASRSLWKSSFLGLSKENRPESYLYFLNGEKGSTKVHHCVLSPPTDCQLEVNLVKKRGSPVLGLPINMYCNSLYIEKKLL